MNWTRSFLGIYLLRCGSCRHYMVCFGRARALSACHQHDEYCPVQNLERIAGVRRRSAFLRMERVRIIWQGSELDGRIGTVSGPAPIVAADGRHEKGYGVTLDEPLADGRADFVVRADRVELAPGGGRR